MFKLEIFIALHVQRQKKVKINVKHKVAPDEIVAVGTTKKISFKKIISVEIRDTIANTTVFSKELVNIFTRLGKQYVQFLE